MESPRYLRITLPPFVFYGAVILAEVFNDTLDSKLEGWADAEILLAITGIVAASIVPLGYLIGGVTLLALWCAARLGWIGYGRHDLPYTRDETRPLLGDLGVQDTDSGDDHLNAARTFVYEARKEWWLDDYSNRLWDAFMGYSGSVVALVLAIGYAVYTCNRSPWWWAIAVAALAVCVLVACYARKEMRTVVAFQIEHRDSIRKALVEKWKPE